MEVEKMNVIQPDILLISPPSVVFEELVSGTHNSLPPVGLSYVAKSLMLHNYSFDIIDMATEGMGKQELIDLLQTTTPQIVGITALVNNYNNGLLVAQIVKQVLPQTKVIMGGPHVSFIPEDALRSGYIDIVCINEGEETIIELMKVFQANQRDLSAIKGIAYLKNEQIIRTEKRKGFTDVKDLGSPVHHIFDYNKYNNIAPIITGRGCPYGCIFCVAHALSGRKYRVRPIEDVIGEIEYLIHEKNVQRFMILDDTFTFYEDRVRDFCERIIQLGLKIKWKCEARVNTVNYDLMTTMKAAGCVGVQFGVESANPEILKEIKKEISLDQVRQAVLDAHHAQLDVKCSFIIGLPMETEEMVNNTIKFAQSLHSLREGSATSKIQTAFAICTPLPGTYIYEHAEELGIKFLTKDWNQYNFLQPVIETRHLKRAQLTNFLVESYRCWRDELDE